MRGEGGREGKREGEWEGGRERGERKNEKERGRVRELECVILIPFLPQYTVCEGAENHAGYV